MAPKRTKAEEALDFLNNLDNFDGDDAGPETSSPAPSVSTSATQIPSGSTPRASTDSARPKSINAPDEKPDEEAAKTLAFLEAQINTKRAPLTSRVASPAPAPQQGPGANVNSPPASIEEANVPSASANGGGGWGGSWWSSATSAIQSAQKMADEGYKRVQATGVSGVTGQLEQLGVKGVDLNQLRKGAEERLGGIVKGVDLEKLRHELMSNATSTLANIMDTVAPPISAHETLELWLSHPMLGYAGVEGVVYRAWMRILEQTESGEMIVVWSPSDDQDARGAQRSVNAIEGWDVAWKSAQEGMKAVRSREEKDPKGRAKANPSLPVTTIPIFLHLQPLLAPLPIPEPSIRLTESSSDPEAASKHLYFLMTLQDPSHSIRFTTISQPSPSDWLEVEYENSDWVEERLVEVLRTGVEILAQDYVATRMGLKPSATIPTPVPSAGESREGSTAENTKQESLAEA